MTDMSKIFANKITSQTLLALPLHHTEVELSVFSINCLNKFVTKSHK